jgi:diguanylate cyclase (GGDEF)-like protein
MPAATVSRAEPLVAAVRPNVREIALDRRRGSSDLRRRSRRAVYARNGALLALGAPAGLLLMRLLIGGRWSWRAAIDDIASDSATYGYVAGATVAGLGAFGAVLGYYSDELALLATTDPLTGLLNARGFDRLLNQEIARVARYGGPLTLLIVDLDGLKRLNDQQGHVAGNRALRAVASAIRDELRAVDVAARLGGDEFCVLAPRTDERAATVLADRICARAAEYLAAAVGGLSTVSIGVASLGPTPPGAGTADSLMKAADAALYEAKRQGGNRVRHTT